MDNLCLHITLAILSSFLLQVIMHELGHLVFGTVTGWNLICLQIHKFAFVKERRYYAIKHLDTGCCQCIMYPKHLFNNAVLYTLGGSFANIFGAFAGILCMILFKMKPVLWIYAWSFSVSGIILGFVNLVPNTKRVCNDGACYKLLKLDKLTGYCHNNQMLIAKQLYEGLTYQQVESQLIIMASECADNDLLAYQAVLEYYYWLDIGEYEKMQKAIGKVVLTASISRNISDIICMEKLYMDLLLRVLGKDKRPIDISRYNNNMSEFVKAHENKGDVHTIRIKAVVGVYEKLMEGDMISAEKMLDDAILLIKENGCLFLGEKIFCLQQLAKMKTLLNYGY